MSNRRLQLLTDTGSTSSDQFLGFVVREAVGICVGVSQGVTSTRTLRETPVAQS